MALDIDWNLRAFTAIRKDPAMKSALRAAGQRVLDRCGGTAAGYELSEYDGANRARVHVRPATAQARRSDAKHGTLSAARDAA